METSLPLGQQEQPSFDQIVKGNIDIKQLCNKNKIKINKYYIIFNKIGKFLKYQTWSASNETLNENRKVYYQNAKIWIRQFNNLNASLKFYKKPLFTPTTVMEIGNNNYAFVIYEAKINKKNQVVFTVSTQEIILSNSTSKQSSKLPCGHHDNVRFDIDPESPIFITSINIEKATCTDGENGLVYPCLGVDKKNVAASCYITTPNNASMNIYISADTFNVNYPLSVFLDSITEINFFGTDSQQLKYNKTLTDKQNAAYIVFDVVGCITIKDLENKSKQIIYNPRFEIYDIFGNIILLP